MYNTAFIFLFLFILYLIGFTNLPYHSYSLSFFTLDITIFNFYFFILILFAVGFLKWPFKEIIVISFVTWSFIALQLIPSFINFLPYYSGLTLFILFIGIIINNYKAS